MAQKKALDKHMILCLSSAYGPNMADISDYLSVKSRGVSLAGVLGDAEHLDFQAALAESDLNDVADLNIVRGFGAAPVDRDAL